MRASIENRAGKRAAAIAFATVLAAGLSFPSTAFAEVNIDGTVINQGENTVGGGTATLADTVLDMVNVVADSMAVTDESLTVNFNGGNKINNEVVVGGSSDVTMNFTAENDVEDITVKGDSTLTVNADGHDDLEELDAFDNANLIVNVTGENDFEEIVGTDNASITIRGTDCQKKDIVNIKDDEKAYLSVAGGNLTIDHVTVNLEGSERNLIGSRDGDVFVDTSKIEAGDDAWTSVIAGKTLGIRESVVKIAGEVFSHGMMTIGHSDVKASKSGAATDELPYRVFSDTGIELIDEKNGEVREGELRDAKVWYVDTDNNDGSDVDLKADGEPGYYKCRDGAPTRATMPKTGDGTNPLAPAAACIASAAIALFASKRRKMT